MAQQVAPPKRGSAWLDATTDDANMVSDPDVMVESTARQTGSGASSSSSSLSVSEEDASARGCAWAPFHLLVRVEHRAVTVMLHTRAVRVGYEHRVRDAVVDVILRTERDVNELLLLEEVDRTKVRVCTHACMCVCVCVCVFACACACVWKYMCMCSC